MTAASAYFFQNKSLAAGFNGAIYTTTFDGQVVNENSYSSKEAVYLNGGPQNQNAAGLPDGTYYFQVTDPSGHTLLSTDSAECRQLLVFSGRVAAADGPSCQHSTGIPNSSNGSTPVKLAPFADTTSNGGVYKAWLIRQGSGTTVASDGMHINFNNNNAKTDNFKVNAVACPNCGPTSLLAGRKFYDTNGNALLDEGEALIQGVQILILAGGTQTVVTTNQSGNWSITVPTGVEYTVLEFLPFTGPDGQPGSYWQQIAPVADSEGFQGYVGTVNGDQTNLNFGNICYVPNSDGNPVASATPCPVSDLPPPDPTPTPTATPCPDCPTTAVMTGKKFYDANRNALFDVGEVPVGGVQIAVVVTTGEGTTLTFATTDESGNWNLTLPVGAQYIISEYLPDTDPVTEPGGTWEQTAPLPNDEGFRGYSGTVGATPPTFNFGNVCFHEGNEFAQATPCAVRYHPRGRPRLRQPIDCQKAA
jgi:hypothetical protein